MMQALERRTLFDATLCDSPVQDPALAAESSASPICDSPVQDPALAAESSTFFYPPPPANQAPVVSADNASVTGDEGRPATNSGRFSDPNFDTVSLTASIGMIGGNSSNGTWSWTFVPPDGPAPTQTVTITASDGRGGTAQTSFSLNVVNVAPTFTLSGPSEVYIGEEYLVGWTNFVDPGQDTVSSWTVDWGDGTTQIFIGNTNMFRHTYAAPPGAKGVTVTATDEDGSYSRGTSVLVKPPLVSVTSSGEASEDRRRPAMFTVSRTGPTSQPLDVYFTLGGSATPGTLDSAGTPSPTNADYTVSWAVRDGSGWKVTIGPNSASAGFMVTPTNDWFIEGKETVTAQLEAPPAGAPGFYALATPNRVEITIESLVAEGEFPGSGRTIEDAEFKAKLDEIDAAVQAQDGNAGLAAEAELHNMLRNSPGSESYVKEERGQYGDATAGRITYVLANSLGITATVRNNTLSASKRNHPLNAERYDVLVTIAPRSGDGVLEAAGDLDAREGLVRLSLPVGETTLKDVRIIPKVIGEVGVVITYIPQKRDPVLVWVDDPAQDAPNAAFGVTLKRESVTMPLL